MAKKQWIDLNGNEVPAQYVPKLDKDRERVTLKHLARAKKLSEQLEKFKTELLEECDAVYEQMLTDNNVPGNSKGGFSISTFDREDMRTLIREIMQDHGIYFEMLMFS